MEKKNEKGSRIMYEQYTGQRIHFGVEEMEFAVQNIAFKQIFHIIPGHSHGDNSFEIHYIKEGEGWLRTNEGTYFLGPGSLFVEGPYQEHAQLSRPENPMAEYCIYLHLKQNPLNAQTSVLFRSLPLAHL